MANAQNALIKVQPLEPSHFKNLSKVEFHIFNSKLVEDKVENLKFSTGDKQRLIKRREMVKSMKFLRKTGNQLRIEQNRQVEALKKFDKQQETDKGNKGSSNKLNYQFRSTSKDLKLALEPMVPKKEQQRS